MKFATHAPTVFCIDTGTNLYLMRSDVLDRSWLDGIRRLDLPDTRSTSDTKVEVSENDIVQLRLDQYWKRVTFVVAGEHIIIVSLVSAFVYWNHKSINQAERNVGSTLLPTSTHVDGAQGMQ